MYSVKELPPLLKQSSKSINARFQQKENLKVRRDSWTKQLSALFLLVHPSFRVSSWIFSSITMCASCNNVLSSFETLNSICYNINPRLRQTLIIDHRSHAGWWQIWCTFFSVQWSGQPLLIDWNWFVERTLCFAHSFDKNPQRPKNHNVYIKTIIFRE